MIFSALATVLYAHEAHFQGAAEGVYGKLIHWIGNFHLIFLHFPIALIITTACADLLFLYSKKPLFSEASRLMILCTAISAILTVLTGFAFAYQMHYEGILATFYWLHLSLGILIALLAVVAVFLRELHANKKLTSLRAYYFCIVALFISVNATGFFGGEMTFGLNYFSH